MFVLAELIFAFTRLRIQSAAYNKDTFHWRFEVAAAVSAAHYAPQVSQVVTTLPPESAIIGTPSLHSAILANRTILPPFTYRYTATVCIRIH